MNALDLLHKIRTCDSRGTFKYSDTAVLNDLINLIVDAEVKAAELATERERRWCVQIIAAAIAEAVSVERERWLFCARIDATMEGPMLRGWNRSELDRLWLATIRAANDGAN